MRATNCMIIVAFMAGFFVSTSRAAIIGTVVKESGGFTLDVQIDDTDGSWEGALVICRLKNGTSSDIDYHYAVGGANFIVDIVDSAGKRAERREGYYRYFRSVDEGVMSSYRRGVVKSNETFVYSFKLLEVYDIQNPSGSVLKVRWDRGNDGGGNRYPVDRDLAIELKLPNLRMAGEPAPPPAALPAPVEPSSRKNTVETAVQKSADQPPPAAMGDQAAPPGRDTGRWMIGGGILSLVVILLLAMAWFRARRS